MIKDNIFKNHLVGTTSLLVFNFCVGSWCLLFKEPTVSIDPVAPSKAL